jgi:nuclear GTP-binding protein
LQYYRNFYPTVTFKSSTQTQRHHLGAGTDSASLSIGGDALLSLVKNLLRTGGAKTSIVIGVAGYPNVGKSSLINSLKRNKAVDIGATPGVTKVAQEVYLDSNIRLLDCPGIVFSKDETDVAVILRNCVKIERIPDVITPVAEIIRRSTPERLMLQYRVPQFALQ